MMQLAMRLLPVGLGDCILLRFPDDSWAVVDCGPDNQAAEQALQYLNRDPDSGDIRFVLVTHPDLDHFGGIRTLLHNSKREIKQFYHSGIKRKRRAGADESLALLRCVEEFFGSAAKGCIKTLRAGETIPCRGIPDLSIQVLNPNDTTAPNERVRGGTECNDASIVLKVKFHEVCLLLPGDVQQRGWASVIERTEFEPPHVLKVSHHGAANGRPHDALFESPTRSSGQGRWALLSTPTDRNGKPDESVLADFWKRPDWRIRCTGWFSDCCDEDKESYPIPPTDSRYPASVRQALDVAVRMGTYERFHAKEGCCIHNEVIIDSDGIIQHSRSQKSCDER